MILFKLFIVFFRVGLFAIGGAYSFLPLLEKDLVQKYNWLSKEEFLDIFGVVKVFPGAISIKYATYTGYKIAGFLGAVAANLGNLLAPSVLVIFASSIYARYKNLSGVKAAFNVIELAVFALIIAVAFQLLSISRLGSPKNLAIVIISFLLFFFAKVHPALIILGAGIIGFFLK